MPGKRLSYTEEQAREAIGNSYSWAESLRKLGLCTTGGGWRVLKKYVEIWGISTDHFDQTRAREGHMRFQARPIEELLVEDSNSSRQNLKRRLYKEGQSKPSIRRVERPPYEQLLAEIKAHGYCWVGRKYGVSDNAVRKWVRFYERERERERAG